jgi:hypothetical protein
VYIIRISLRIINLLIFIMGTDCVICEAETEVFIYKVDERHSSNQRLGFNPGPVHVRRMVNEVGL